MYRKRIPALLLAAAVLVTLFSGCDWPRGKTPAPTDPAQETSSAAPRIRTVEAGGVKIRLDESQYDTYSPGEQLCTPISDGPLDSFVPSLKYGDVFPYVASRLYGSSEDGYTWEGSSLYGLADSKGQLLTDGLYVSAYPIYSYSPRNDSYHLPFWVLSRYNAVTVTHHDSDWGGWDELEGRAQSALVAMDGSFMIPFGDYHFTGGENCFFAVENRDNMMGYYSEANFIAYDLNGAPLFYSADLRLDTRCDTVSVMETEEMVKIDRTFFDQENYDRNTTDYYDLQGNHLLGPFRRGSAFNDGLACVTQDGYNYGYINKSGSWVIPPKYQYNAEFVDGLAVQKRGDGSLVLLRSDGTEIMQTSAPNMYLSDGLVQVSYDFDYAASANYSEYYDLEGNLLFEGYILATRINDTAYILRSYGGNPQVEIRDLEHPEKNTIFRGEYNITPTYLCRDDQLVSCTAIYSESAKIILVNNQTLEVTETTATGDYNEAAEEFYQQQMVTDSYTGRIWYLVREKGKWILFNEEGELVFRFVSDDMPTVINGYITAADSTACTVYDTTGKIVFRRRLDAED